MENNNPNPCRCDKSSCACSRDKAERCSCGEQCRCTPTCQCGNGCGCNATGCRFAHAAGVG